MAEATIRRESKRLHQLWREVPVGTARGWFVLGAMWGLAWATWGARSSASKFAGGNEWECDKPRPHPRARQ